jgi:hypothetical protein
MNNPNEPTQSEKREVLRDTYLSRAQADADLAAQGRCKKETTTRVTGVPEYPKQPSSSRWASDPVPHEEPLGFAVDETPPNSGGGQSGVGVASSPADNLGGSAVAPSATALSDVEISDPPIFSSKEANEK